MARCALQVTKSGSRRIRKMLSARTSRRRGGFTLIETIVTVGLLAVLAAFVVPTVIQKAGVGDPVKVSSDVTSIRSALETCMADIGGFPNQIRMLTDAPTGGNHLVDSTTAITGGQIAAWKGPYLSATIGTLPGDSVATGYAAFVKNFVTRYDADDNAAEFYLNAGAGTGGTFNANRTLFATITIVGLTVPQAQIVNKLIDGGSDPDVVAGPYLGANTTGRFRYDKPSAAGVVVAYYLASPITK